MALTRPCNGVAELTAPSSGCAEGGRTGLDRRGLPFWSLRAVFPATVPFSSHFADAGLR